MTDKWRIVEGRGISRLTQAAVVVWSEYSWTRYVVSIRMALLSRSVYDPDCVKGWSGSVLCLGRETDPAVQVVVLQNFQISMKIENYDHDHRKAEAEGIEFLKVDFLLSQEIDIRRSR